MTYRYLQTRRDGPVEYLTLNRPDVRNAFNDEVVTELRQWADGTALDAQVRVAVVAGAGKVFSAGADAAWMARMAEASAADNEADALATTAMLGAINTLPMVVIGRVHGAALGGGSGLAAVCDIVVADDRAIFGFTETRLGILPSMISPSSCRRSASRRRVNCSSPAPGSTRPKRSRSASSTRWCRPLSSMRWWRPTCAKRCRRRRPPWPRPRR